VGRERAKRTGMRRGLWDPILYELCKYDNADLVLHSAHVSGTGTPKEGNHPSCGEVVENLGLFAAMGRRLPHRVARHS
jgi:hypothetical protein